MTLRGKPLPETPKMDPAPRVTKALPVTPGQPSGTNKPLPKLPPGNALPLMDLYLFYIFYSSWNT